MEIHRPKHLETWRDLAKEVGVIVLGVCLALIGEQTVEWLHWRHEVSDTRDALNAEISHNMGVLEARSSQAACIQQRLSDIRTVLAARAAGQSAALKAPLGQPLFWRPATSVWQTALSGEIAAHMPLEMRLRYAGFYDYLNWFAAREAEEADAWAVLGSLNDLSGPDPQGVWALRAARSRAQTLADKVDAYTPILRAKAQELTAKAAQVQGFPGMERRLQAFCRPLI
jgi:hypothetical protein